VVIPEKSLSVHGKQVLHRKATTNTVRDLRNIAGKEESLKAIYYYEKYSSSISRPIRGQDV
jgi:hypothetical protein